MVLLSTGYVIFIYIYLVNLYESSVIRIVNDHPNYRMAMSRLKC